MVFGQALELMKIGYKVKLPSWSGYWYWNKDKETVMMHTKDGEDTDIRDVKPVEYIIHSTVQDTWEIATKDNCKELEKELIDMMWLDNLIEDCCYSFIEFHKSEGINSIIKNLKYLSQKQRLIDYIMSSVRRAINNEQSK